MRGCKIEPDSVVFDMLMNSISKVDQIVRCNDHTVQ
jgi:hypothetical protein